MRTSLVSFTYVLKSGVASSVTIDLLDAKMIALTDKTISVSYSLDPTEDFDFEFRTDEVADDVYQSMADIWRKWSEQ